MTAIVSIKQCMCSSYLRPSHDMLSVAEIAVRSVVVVLVFDGVVSVSPVPYVSSLMFKFRVGSVQVGVITCGFVCAQVSGGVDGVAQRWWRCPMLVAVAHIAGQTPKYVSCVSPYISHHIVVGKL